MTSDADVEICGVSVKAIKAILYKHIRPPTEDEGVVVKGWEFGPAGDLLLAGTAVYMTRAELGVELRIEGCWFNKPKGAHG